jgi:mono/diheme cytochrome c family protein
VKTLSVALILILAMIAGCTDSVSTSTNETPLPPGDASRGQVLFASSQGGLPSCQSCHAITAARGSGPGLADYATQAATRRSGESAEQYTVHAILNPGRFIVQGYSNLMPGNYGSKLSTQDVADLTAYLLSL